MIASTLIAWHARHGRHDLPWQRSALPIECGCRKSCCNRRRWPPSSAITSASCGAFPTSSRWPRRRWTRCCTCGRDLGYYSRARNLHRSAQRVISEHGGELPAEAAALAELPGIGRSTAAAIVALSMGQRASILDGNVKRVLARYFAIDGSPGDSITERELWDRAEQCTPQSDFAVYTQAIMDFGATVCTRHDPLCVHCPLRADCVGAASGPRARVARAARAASAPDAPGIHAAGGGQRWPGTAAATPAARHLGRTVDAAGVPDTRRRRHNSAHRAGSGAARVQPLPGLRHAFTHFELEITPLRARCRRAHAVMEGGGDALV